MERYNGNERDYVKELNDLRDKTMQYSKIAEECDKKLLELQISNRKALYAKTLELLFATAAKQEELENKQNSKIEALVVQRNKKEIEEFRKWKEVELEDAIATANEEAKAKGKVLSAEEEKEIRDKFKNELDAGIANILELGKIKEDEELRIKKAVAKVQAKNDKQALADKYKAAMEEAKKAGLKGKELAAFIESTMAEAGATADEGKKAAKSEARDEAARKAAEENWNKALDVLKQLDNTIDDIGSMKGIVDTRLQGSKNATGDGFLGIGSGSYWEAISEKIVKAAGASPLVKQSDVVSKVKEMINSGISFNVEQRAFLATISEKIANTFDANDGTLKRLIRIQQQDSTAARLGMESAMTAFLNNMYETTEYLSDLASSIRSSIEEATSLMSASDAIGFEYQMQKWMGSLYSVGMSSAGVQSLADSLGKLASGNISGITEGGTGNLLVMAANNAGLNIADALASGLDDSDLNNLMNSVVLYLQQIYGETKNSKVLQQQFASVYGLTASDLKAAANLSGSVSNISKSYLNYGGAMMQLNNMANSMYSRTSVGEMLSNTWDNIQYSMAAGIASNPVTYGIYKAAGLLDAVAGGIALPDIKVMGSGVNLQTSVADLMRVAAMSGGILSSIGNLANLKNGFSGNAMLTAMGVDTSGNSITAVSRGGASGLINTGGSSVSESGYVGNSSGGDVYGSTMTDATDSSKSQLVEAEKESDEVTNKQIKEEIVAIYELLNSLREGENTLRVSAPAIEAFLLRTI